MAVQLRDVQEIIEKRDVLAIPGSRGVSREIINLRGLIVPILHVRKFYGEPPAGDDRAAEGMFIICRAESQTIALEVDRIISIYKQEKYQKATSHKPELAGKADTLDRLIIFDGGVDRKEHVLVVNVHNLIRNHLELAA